MPRKIKVNIVTTDSASPVFRTVSGSAYKLSAEMLAEREMTDEELRAISLAEPPPPV